MKIYTNTQSNLSALQDFEGTDLWIFCTLDGFDRNYDTFGYLQVVNLYEDSPNSGNYICDCHFFECRSEYDRTPRGLFSMKSILKYTHTYYASDITVEFPIEALTTEDLIDNFEGGQY